MEQERLEKLARKGQKAEDTSPSSGGADAKASDFTASTSSTAGVSTDKYRNYVVVAGVVTGLGALLYLKSHLRIQKTLSKVIELNNNPPGYFCSEAHVGHFRTTIRFEGMNNKRSDLFCTKFHFGHGGATMRWIEFPQRK